MTLDLPADVNSAVRHCLQLFERGEHQEAELLAEDICFKFPRSQWAAHVYAELAAKGLNWEEAVRRWRLVRERFPDDPAGYTQAGMALLRQNNPRSALSLLSEALRLFPNCADVWIQYAEAFMQKGEWINACVYWGLARENFPEQVAPYVRGVYALVQVGWIVEAEALVNRAFLKFKDNAWVAHAYADFPVWRRDFAGAIARWDLVRNQFDTNVAGYIRSCELLSSAGRVREFHELASLAATKFPDNFTLGKLAANAEMSCGDPVLALNRWTALRSMFPSRSEAWIGGANALRLLGQTHEAWNFLSSGEKTVELLAQLAQPRLELAIDLNYTIDAMALWAEIQSADSVPSERFYQETWRLYAANVDAKYSKSLISVLLDEPARKREDWLPQIVIGVYALLSDPEMFSKVQQQILEALTLEPNKKFRQENIARAMLDESADEELFRELLDLYSANGLRQVIYALFSSVNRQAVGLQEFHNRARSYLRNYIDLQASRFIGDPSSVKENQAYSLFVLAYVFYRQRFHDMVVATRREMAGITPGLERLRAAWGNAFPTLSSICSKTISNAPLIWGSIAVKPLSRRLNIALCISGQLRGFQLANPSWSHLGLQAHNVTTIVHTWGNVGRRFPDPSHCSRVFAGNFLTTYLEITRVLSMKSLLAKYPGFFSFFKSPLPVDPHYLRSFYKTDHVVIELDNEGPYANFTNSMKMYHKIEAAHEYACSLHQDYDLMIRIRPDKSIRAARAIDWASVAYISSEQRRLFCDMPPTTSPPGYFEIGDQFAVGAPSAMAVYARAWTITKDPDCENLYGMPRGYRGHVNLAASTLHNGVMVDHFQFVEFGPELDPDKPSSAEICTLLENDIGTRIPDATDRALLAAAKLDCNG